MYTNHLKFYTFFLLFSFISTSCKAFEEVNASTPPPLPNPSIKCDTCPEITPPPPPPPLVDCPPPPPPPCDPPPPPPVEPPCSPCMSHQLPPPPPSPPKYYSPPGGNLYVTGYNTYDDSGGPRIGSAMSGILVFVMVALLEVIIL